MAVAPIVTHHHTLPPKPKPAALVYTGSKEATHTTPKSALPLPKTDIPKLPVAAPKVNVPNVPPVASDKQLATACVGVPHVGQVAGVEVDVSKNSLIGTLTGAIKQPIAIGSKLCK